MRDIEVIVEGEHIECKEGTDLLELAQRYQRKYQDDIVACHGKPQIIRAVETGTGWG